MRAISFTEYGPPDVLRIREVDVPAPKDEQVLVKVHAAGVNPLDWHFVRGIPYFLRMMVGLRRPRTSQLGFDVAGVVEAVGAKVTQFKPGDEVFGTCDAAFAEYACTAESGLVTKPRTITFEQAAAAPVSALTAWQGLRGRSGRILINGAAGGVGTFAVQIAKASGAHVTGVCSTRNVEMLRSLGADHVVDYTRDDFTASGERYDLIFDLIGNHSLSACRRALSPNGTYLLVGGQNGRWIEPLPRAIRGAIYSRFVSQKFSMLLTKRSQEDLLVIRELLETGKVTPVIDRVYKLSQVAAAIAYLEAGHARGKVVIRPQ